MNQPIDVLIVGAGISGLLAAGELQKAGFQVQTVEMEQTVGGRLATQPIRNGRADIGAQFFTVRTAKFQQYVNTWLQKDLIFVWSYGWSDGSLGGSTHDGYPRYAARNGMNSIAQYLARPLTNIQLNTRLAAIRPLSDSEKTGNWKAGGWEAADKNGQVFRSRALILTPPVPRSLALLAAGATPLHRDDQSSLTRITYAPSLCATFWVNGKVHLPEPGALQRPLSPISWIADNQRKGISPEATLITMQSSPAFSQAHCNDSDKDVMAELRAALTPHLDGNAIITEEHLMRWRCALPLTLYPERTLLAQNLPPLAFAGDAFKEPRVEGAALSGLAASAAIAAALTQLNNQP
ncbi:MAG: FAD-dependent oxidoreductase [Ardenticatenaceae bacterium]|nr:FAD-dependent oxidoreductase [Anaerolineales bacterium]MCB8920089.1 FAD-dependent oxidoreductase [Ardenticatenaceae bacterium]